MAAIEVEQAWAARLPYPSRYPTAKLVAWMLGEAGLLRPFEYIHAIDVTYGQGILWHALRSKAVVAGVDVRRLDWVVRPRCFIKAPAQRWREWLPRALDCLNGRVDVVMVDPPFAAWRRGRWLTGRRHYDPALAVGRPEDILRAGLELAGELGAPVVYHWREPVDGRHLVGPVAFKPFHGAVNPKSRGYRSYFDVLGV